MTDNQGSALPTTSPATIPEEQIDQSIRTALWLAQQGFGIIECHGLTTNGSCDCGNECASQGKHPVGQEWQRKATRSPATITQRVTRRHGQYGVIPGPRGLILDVDRPDQFALTLPETYRVVSTPADRNNGQAKEHRYYRLPTDFDASALPATMPWGEIRVEGANRFVVGPHSSHHGGWCYEPQGDRIVELSRDDLGALFGASHEPPAHEDRGPYRLPSSWHGSWHEAITPHVGSLFITAPGTLEQARDTAWAEVLSVWPSILTDWGTRRQFRGGAKENREMLRLVFDEVWDSDARTPRMLSLRADRMAGRADTAREQDALSADDDKADGWVASYGNDISLPADVRPEAFWGPIGEFARAVGGVNTMASPLGLLTTGLAAYSALLGHGTYRIWNEARTVPQEFQLIVGRTGAGKGVTLRVTRRWLDHTDGFDPSMLITDFSSGEGLVTRLLGIPPEVSSGSTMALAWSEEFASVLRAKNREGSTIAQYVRRAYDGMPMQRNLSKPGGEVKDPAIAFTAHITPEELMAETDLLDAASGFLNRFTVIPLVTTFVDNPPALAESVYVALGLRLSHGVKVARSFNAPAIATPGAIALLKRVDTWQRGASNTPGVVGKMLERIGQNVHRRALLFCLTRTDQETRTPEIVEEDVLAAVAVGDVSERTIIALWAESPGSPEQARILARVRESGNEGVTPSDLLHTLWGSRYRARGRTEVSRMLEQHLLTKRRSHGGWRLFPGGVAMPPSLWHAVVEGGPGDVPTLGGDERQSDHRLPHIPQLLPKPTTDPSVYDRTDRPLALGERPSVPRRSADSDRGKTPPFVLPRSP